MTKPGEMLAWWLSWGAALIVVGFLGSAIGAEWLILGVLGLAALHAAAIVFDRKR